MRRVFTFPENGDHPPARAVVEKLKTVDAAREGRLAFRVPGFVSAPYVRNSIPTLHAIGDRVFEESLFAEIVCPVLRVFIGAERCGRDLSGGIFAAGNEPRAIVEKRSETIPIAGTRWTGDRVVDGADDVIDRVHVGRTSRLRRRRRGLCIRSRGGILGCAEDRASEQEAKQAERLFHAH